MIESRWTIKKQSNIKKIFFKKLIKTLQLKKNQAKKNLIKTENNFRKA